MNEALRECDDAALKGVIEYACEVGVKPDVFVAAIEDMAHASDAQTRAMILWRAAFKVFEQGKLGLATAAWERARVLFLEAQADREAAWCALNLSTVCIHRCDYRSALRQLSVVRQVTGALGHDSLVMQAARNRAICLYHLGETRQALTLHRRALTLARKLSKSREEAQCRANLGNCYKALGELRRAQREYKRAIQLSTSAGDHVAAAD